MLSTNFVERNVRNRELLGQMRHRPRPHEFVKLFTRKSPSQDLIQLPDCELSKALSMNC